MSVRVAAIDIGTVTCRLLIADVDAMGVHSVRTGRGMCNLGQGVDSAGVLSDQAMQRVRQQVESYVQAIEECQLPGQRMPVLCVATSATRDAANTSEFTDMIEALGVRVEVISGAEEGSLTFAGASAGFAGEHLMVVDAGGGSTEVVCGTAGSAPSAVQSFDVGCRRLTERFLHADPPDSASIRSARQCVRDAMAGFFDQLAQQGGCPQRMLATAGCATSVAAMLERMQVYDSDKVHGYVVSAPRLDALADQVASLPLAARQQLPGLEASRAPIIVAGIVILQEVLALSGLGSFTVSEADILHGIALKAAQHFVS